jgi:hypothetical protein
MRFLLLILLLFSLSGLRADELSNRLRLLLPGDDASTVNERQFLHQRVRLLFVALEGDKVEHKSTKKKIRRITDRLKRDHLRTYKADASVADAFRNGAYNDATAALLTALAFEHFGVGYYGYVDHWEAYLIADPGNREDEVYHPNHAKHDDVREAAFRRDYFELLRATTLADVPNMTTGEVEQLFDRYYYPPDKKLTFGQLTAFLQYRRAQAAYAASEYQRAIDLLETAMSKEERPAFLVLRKAAELQLRAATKPEVEGDILTLFAHWTERPDNHYLPAAILQYFDEQQRLLLAENRLLEAAELLSDYLGHAPAGKTKWAENMNDLHQFRLLRHHFVNGRPDLARRLAESLYNQDPENESLKFVLAEIILDELRRSRLTGGDFVAAITTAATRYPFICERDRFMNLQLRELAWKVRDDYERDDAATGKQSLQRFRSALLGIPVNEDRSVWTLTAFLAASNYHFRVMEYDQARFFVAEGLKYNANDEYLLHRRDVLARY